MHAEVAVGNGIIETADVLSPTTVPSRPNVTFMLYDPRRRRDICARLAAGARPVSKSPTAPGATGKALCKTRLANHWYIAMVKGWTPVRGIRTVAALPAISTARKR